jgi:hypothetical protein
LARAAVRLAFHDAGEQTRFFLPSFFLPSLCLALECVANTYSSTSSAGTFSLALQAAGKPNGAADGSMLTDPNEVLRTENNGLQGIVAALKDIPGQVNQPPGDVLHVRLHTLLTSSLPSLTHSFCIVGRYPRCRKPPPLPADCPTGLTSFRLYSSPVPEVPKFASSLAANHRPTSLLMVSSRTLMPLLTPSLLSSPTKDLASAN